MLSYLMAGFAAGTFSALTCFLVPNAVLAKRQATSTTLKQLAVMEKVEELESRVLQTVVPAIEKAAKESAAMVEGLKQFEARSTSFQNAVTSQLSQMVEREELNEWAAGVVTRSELELALQSAAHQILRAAQNSSGSNGNGRDLSRLQEQVAGISQQLGLG